MSPASFRISLDDPPPAPAAKPANPAALTREERSNAGWHLRFIGWIIGLPSVLSVAFVGAVGLWYAWATAADTKSWLALSAGIVIVTLFTAGLPIGAALNRENAPGVAKAAFGFWLACILLNLAVMAHFAWERPEVAAPASASVTAPHLSAADAGRLDWQIAKLWYALSDFKEAVAAEPARFGTPENRRRFAGLQAELQGLETKRYGAPAILKEVRGRLEFQRYAVTETPARSASAPGLDLAAVALLMLIGAALGLLISASSLAAILTEKAATVRVEKPEPAPQPAPSPVTAYHPGESADGFEHWAIACVSKLTGKSVRPAEAHASYLAFCARNDYQAPLAIQEFGRRFRGWLMDTYGIDGRHSNGTVFDGVTLTPLGPSITAPLMNGGAA
jgi:hypothetical protein